MFSAKNIVLLTEINGFFDASLLHNYMDVISIGTLFSLINISFQMRKDNFLLNWKRLLSSFILTNVLASIMFVAIKLFGINTENSLNNLLVNIPLGVLVIGISMTIIFFLFRNSFNLPDIH